MAAFATRCPLRFVPWPVGGLSARDVGAAPAHRLAPPVKALAQLGLGKGVALQRDGGRRQRLLAAADRRLFFQKRCCRAEAARGRRECGVVVVAQQRRRTRAECCRPAWGPAAVRCRSKKRPAAAGAVLARRSAARQWSAEVRPAAVDVWPTAARTAAPATIPTGSARAISAGGQ